MDKVELKQSFIALDIDKDDTELTEIINKYKTGDAAAISKEDFKKVFEPALSATLGEVDPDLNHIAHLYDH